MTTFQAPRSYTEERETAAAPVWLPRDVVTAITALAVEATPYDQTTLPALDRVAATMLLPGSEIPVALPDALSIFLAYSLLDDDERVRIAETVLDRLPNHRDMSDLAATLNKFQHALTTFAAMNDLPSAA